MSNFSPVQRPENPDLNDAAASAVDASYHYKMARGVASPAPASLPRVSFVKIVGENSATRAGVHDNQQRSYGCV